MTDRGCWRRNKEEDRGGWRRDRVTDRVTDRAAGGETRRKIEAA